MLLKKFVNYFLVIKYYKFSKYSWEMLKERIHVWKGGKNFKIHYLLVDLLISVIIFPKILKRRCDYK